MRECAAGCAAVERKKRTENVRADLHQDVALLDGMGGLARLRTEIGSGHRAFLGAALLVGIGPIGVPRMSRDRKRQAGQNQNVRNLPHLMSMPLGTCMGDERRAQRDDPAGLRRVSGN